MKTYPCAGGDLELTNLLSSQSAKARVVGTRRPKDGAFLGIAVALVVPETSAELAKIEPAIKSGRLDPRVVREFRDAVDHVRKTAWAVQEFQERQLQKHDSQTVLSLLTTERIRRATQLSKARMTDLAAHQITRETAEIDEFFRALESRHQGIADLLRNRES